MDKGGEVTIVIDASNLTLRENASSERYIQFLSLLLKEWLSSLTFYPTQEGTFLSTSKANLKRCLGKLVTTLSCVGRECWQGLALMC